MIIFLISISGTVARLPQETKPQTLSSFLADNNESGELTYYNVTLCCSFNQICLYISSTCQDAEWKHNVVVWAVIYLRVCVFFLAWLWECHTNQVFLYCCYNPGQSLQYLGTASSLCQSQKPDFKYNVRSCERVGLSDSERMRGLFPNGGEAFEFFNQQ